MYVKTLFSFVEQWSVPGLSYEMSCTIHLIS